MKGAKRKGSPITPVDSPEGNGRAIMRGSAGRSTVNPPSMAVSSSSRPLSLSSSQRLREAAANFEKGKTAKAKGKGGSINGTGREVFVSMADDYDYVNLVNEQTADQENGYAQTMGTGRTTEDELSWHADTVGEVVKNDSEALEPRRKVPRTLAMKSRVPDEVQPTRYPDRPPNGDLFVFCNSGRPAPRDAILTLVGDYEDWGENHEARVYRRKQQIKGYKGVFLYFWDNRDGPEEEGWWFGEEVGGNQVWAKNDSKSLKPPITGWRLPWDGDVRHDFIVEVLAETGGVGTQTTNGTIRSKAEAMDPVRDKILQEAQEGQLGEDFLKLTEAVTEACDEVETAEIMSQPLLNNLGQDLSPAMQKILRDTEAKARAAQALIVEAQRQVTAKVRSVQSWVPDARDKAFVDFQKLHDQLKLAQQKLRPIQDVRRAADEQCRHRAALDDLAGIVAAAEVEAAKALNFAQDLPVLAEVAADKAQRSIRALMLALEPRLSGAEGPAMEELQRLRDKSTTAQDDVDQSRRLCKERAAKIAYEDRIYQSTERVEEAENSIQEALLVETAVALGSADADESTLRAAVAKARLALARANDFVGARLAEAEKANERDALESLAEVKQRSDKAEVELQALQQATTAKEKHNMEEEYEATQGGWDDYQEWTVNGRRTRDRPSFGSSFKSTSQSNIRTNIPTPSVMRLLKVQKASDRHSQESTRPPPALFPPPAPSRQRNISHRQWQSDAGNSWNSNHASNWSQSESWDSW